MSRGQASQITVDVDVIVNAEYVETHTIYTSSSAYAYETSSFGETRRGATNAVNIIYPLDGVTGNIATPVTVGDMIEYVIRVNLDAKGAPVPSSNDAAYSSYVKTTTEFGGGVITVGMS